MANIPIDIDGSVKSGSGTIVRYGLSLASILHRELCIKNIRAGRKKPGLQPQHLKTVEACCQLTAGTVENLKPGASRIKFLPGKKINSGKFIWDIGTAGSTTMMALCLLPLGLFADKKSTYILSGGLFQDFAPNAFHMKYVLLNLLKKFCAEAGIEVMKPGYVPTGGGVIKMEIEPVKGTLKPLRLTKQGKVTAIKGIAVSSHLKEREVSRRMSDACKQVLDKAGYEADIEIINDKSAKQRGAALFIYALTDKGCVIGADMAGKLGRPAEKIGRYVANSLLEDINSGATVDRFTADQLILYAAIAEGESEYLIPQMTAHIDSNMWLVENILGAEVSLQDKKLIIRGVGLRRS